MTQYITEAYVQARIGTKLSNALKTRPDANNIDIEELIKDHSDSVLGMLRATGYVDPDDSTPGTSPPRQVMKMTFAFVMDELYGLAKLKTPDTYLRAMGEFTRIQEGKAEVVGLALKNDGTEIGGIKSTDVSSTTSDGRPPRFLNLTREM